MVKSVQEQHQDIFLDANFALVRKSKSSTVL